MSLIINQGKHDISKDNQFTPIVENDVLAQITEIKLSDKTDALDITFRLLDGKHKGRNIWDTVYFNPTSPMAWKYRTLRRCAGSPYVEGEANNIDIEALLLNKAVKMDLSVRKGKPGTSGEGKEFQDIKYKEIKLATTEPVATAPAVQTAPDIDEITDPIPQTPAPSVAPSPATASPTLNLADDEDWN